MNQQFNFRDRPLVDEMKAAEKIRNKRHLQKLLLEYRIAEFNKEQEQAAKKARILA